ncbi:DUF4365 domain-containing protein [Bacillus cereus]|nr:DUF4365 domain-containing protein [Bacillus cereus]
MRWLYTDVPQESDLGIDGYVEVLDNIDHPTGQSFGVQCKSGSSHFKMFKEDDKLYLSFDTKHFNYWKSHTLPIIIMMNVEGEISGKYWAYFTEENIRRVGAEKCTIHVPWGNKIEEENDDFIKKFKQKLKQICDTHNQYQRNALFLNTALPLFERLKEIEDGFAVTTGTTILSESCLICIEFCFYDRKLNELDDSITVYTRFNEDWGLEEHLKQFKVFDLIYEDEIVKMDFTSSPASDFDPGDLKLKREHLAKTIGVKINDFGKDFFTVVSLLNEK